MLKQYVLEGFVVLSFCVCVGLTVGTLAAGSGWFPDLSAGGWWSIACVNAHIIISRLAGD